MPKLAGKAFHGRSPASSGTVRETVSSEPATSPVRSSSVVAAGGVAVPSLVLPTEYAGDVAVDTETNALFADDGARTAIVSVGWWKPKHVAGCADYCYRAGCVEAYAFPFDQGVRDKPGRGKRFQLDLFQDDDVNLPVEEWAYLLAWLGCASYDAQYDGSMGLWEPVAADTSTPLDTPIEYVSCAGMSLTEHSDRNAANASVRRLAQQLLPHMAGNALVAVNPGPSFSLSTTSTTTEPNTDASSPAGNRAELGTRHTSGSATTDTRPVSKSSVPTVTWPKGGTAAHPKDTPPGWTPRELVGQNIGFDLEKLRVGTRHFAGIELEDQVVWDTMLGNKELDPQYPTGLKPSTERLFGDTSDEQSALKPYLGPKDDPRFDLVPWDVIEPYATWDAIKTLRLAAQQRDRIYG